MPKKPTAQISQHLKIKKEKGEGAMAPSPPSCVSEQAETRAPRIGLYPGTFDPITLGHLEIINRALKIVDKLVIGVAQNVGKNPLFDCKTRVKLIQNEIQPLLDKGAKIEVYHFDNLLVDYARQVGASVIIRGLRAVSDFEYEIQMADMNHKMCRDVTTVFLMACSGHQFISSSFVKEIAKLGGDVHPFVSDNVCKTIAKKYAG